MEVGGSRTCLEKDKEGGSVSEGRLQRRWIEEGQEERREGGKEGGGGGIRKESVDSHQSINKSDFFLRFC